jgi:ankyrin repeat protein
MTPPAPIRRAATRITPAALAAVLLLAASCRLDTNIMRQNVLEQSSGAEKLFFLENVGTNPDQSNLGALARDAARAGHVHVLQYLQSRGADLSQSDANGWSPILLAASQGQFATVRYLVEIIGADVRAKNRTKVNCLMLAAGAGNLDICRYLLDRGANVDAKSTHGTTSLMYAAGSGDVELARHLVQRGADTQVKDNFGNNALDYAGGDAMSEFLQSLGLK